MKSSIRSCLILICLLPWTLLGQRSLTLSFVNGKDSQPVVGVAFDLQLCNATYQLVTGEKGTVKQPFLPSDTCQEVRVRVMSAFYEPLDSVVRLAPQKERYSFRLAPVSILVEDVTISAFQLVTEDNAKGTTFKFNPKAVLPGTKMDVALSLVPGVIARGLSFRLNGEQKDMKLLIDGVEASAEELKVLKAEEISRVEVRPLTLDNEKYAGELNIIRKPGPPQFYGEVSSFTSFLREGGQVSSNFHVRTKRVEFTLSGNYDLNRQYHEVYRKTTIGNAAPSEFFTERESKINRYFGFAKLNFSLTDKWKMSLSYVLANNKSFQYLKEREQLRETLFQQLYLDGFHSVNFLMRYDLNKKSRLTAKGQFVIDRLLLFPVKNLSSESAYDSRLFSYNAQLSYNRDSVAFWSMVHDFEVGYRFTARRFNETKFDKAYDLHSIFLTDYIQFPRGFSLYLMLKGEVDRYLIGAESRYSPSFLPSATFQYRNRRIGSFRLTYSRLIARAGLSYLNPARIYYPIQGLYLEGNRDLAHRFTQQVSLSYSRPIGMSYLGLVVRYSDQKNIIDPVFINPNTQKYENAGSARFISTGLSYSLSLLEDKLNVNLSLYATHNQFFVNPEFKASSLSLGNKGWDGSAYFSVSYRAPYDFSFRLTADYTPLTLNFNATRYVETPYLYLSVNKSFVDGKYRVGVSYGSMFNMGNRVHDVYHLRNAKREFWGFSNISTVNVSFSISFGKSFRTNSYGTTIKNDDIINSNPR